ncbi:ferric reductase like transmembrane component-domain-containing protein [Morchella snyderi]|nr:ferric reductase like transmembrane component-domain-containing protein [Morchella snyderi]
MTETGAPPIQDGDVDLRALIRLSMSNKIFEFTSHILSPISTSSSSEKGDLSSSSTNSDAPTRPPPHNPGVPFSREIVSEPIFKEQKAPITPQAIHRGLTNLSLSDPGPSSSGASTPLNDERKPLIPRSRGGGGGGAKGIKPLSILHRIRGVLAYQPAHIKLFGLCYDCPPISTCIVTAFYYALNVFYAFHRIVFHPLKMFAFADRLGLVFVANLPLLYLMAAKNFPVKLLTGWSYEQLNVLHRAVGRVCITTAIGHFATFIWVWDKTLDSLLSFRQFVSNPVIFLGLLAWVSYLLIGVTSKEEFRNAFYEVFLFVHVLFQMFALAFLYFHHKGSRPYVLVCAFIFVTDRIVLRLTIRSTRATATVTILPDKKTVRVTLRPNPRSPLKWYAGDHVFLSIPSVAYLHPHPFSIASTPGNSLEFLIRARDGFSKKLLEAATNGPSEFTAIVDGPYGSSDVALLVAGGSEDLRKLGVEIVTHVTQNNVVVGKRPKMKDVVESVECDLRSSDSRSDGGRERGSMGVVVCGPSGMVRDTRNSCAGMMRRGLDVRIVTEKFGW